MRWSELLVLLGLALTACGGEKSSPTDASTEAAPADATVAESSSDASSALDALADTGASDGGVVGQEQCAVSVSCGNPGQSCCSQATANCWCQSYGQPRCLAVAKTDAGGQPYGDAGSAGAPCTASNQCDVGLTCVTFGPTNLCLYCGD